MCWNSQFAYKVTISSIFPFNYLFIYLQYFIVWNYKSWMKKSNLITQCNILAPVSAQLLYRGHLNTVHPALMYFLNYAMEVLYNMAV